MAKKGEEELELLALTSGERRASFMWQKSPRLSPCRSERTLSCARCWLEGPHSMRRGGVAAVIASVGLSICLLGLPRLGRVVQGADGQADRMSLASALPGHGAEAREACMVHLFEHENFEGRGASFPAGVYNLAGLLQGGAKNDGTKSIRVRGGCTATLYEHSFFSGWAVEFTEGAYNLTDMEQLGAAGANASALIVQANGAPIPAPGLLPWEDALLQAAEVEERMNDTERHSLIAGLGFLTIENWVGATSGVPHLGVPPIRMQDSSGGFRPTGPGEYGTSTSWPSLLAMAASWDEASVQKVAAAIGREFRGKGANMVLGPGVNVHRTPYGGRNWEYLSGEDPYLGSRLAKAYVEGVQSEGVIAVVKHFAFNEQETARGSENSIVSEKAAWEIYYPPFEAAVRAGAAGFMCSYNKINGTYACESEDALVRDLRGRMGYNGFVMSDWGAAHSTAAIAKGLDMEQPSPEYFVKEKLVKQYHSDMRAAARRVLAAMFRLRLDMRPGCELPCSEERATNQRTGEHVALAEEAAIGSVVLLQNNGVLPIDPLKVRTLAIIGAASTVRDILNTWGAGSPYSGGGSGHVAAPTVVTPLEGIVARAAALGIQVITTDQFQPIEAHAATHQLGASEAASRRLQGAPLTVQDADLAIVVAATTATESTDRLTLNLDNGADDVISAVAKLLPTVVLLEVPGPVMTPWRDEVAAVACLLTGGERTGSAWAKVLFGDVNPSGRLPVTFPSSLTRTIRPLKEDVPYEEEMFTSYRSAALRNHVAYPFGHGLSYAKFQYSAPQLVSTGCDAAVCVIFQVCNVGLRAGREVAQAYVQFGADVREPQLILKGFQKTSLLGPGDQEEVLLRLSPRDLSVYDVAAHGWVQQSRLLLHIGASSADIRQVLPLAVAGGGTVVDQ